jgi:hypothetical protein
MSNQLETKSVEMQTNSGFMQIASIEDAVRCAEIIALSSFCPKSMNGKPGDILVALQMGQELGLKPMQALQNIAVINGRPSLWGDAMLAVCRLSPDFEFIKEEYLEKDRGFVCTVKRRHEPEFISKFSEVDAKTAGLWNKEGPWKIYPKRMLQMRARGFALRDAFPDLLRGIIIKEEAEDMPTPRKDYSNTGSTIEGEVVVAWDGCINDQQIELLEQKIIEAGKNQADICKALKINGIEFLQSKDFDTVLRRLNSTIKSNQASEMPINQMFKEEERGI